MPEHPFISNQYPEIGALAIDAQILSIIPLAEFYNFKLVWIIFMQKRNGNSHQSGIILGYVLSLIHIYTIAVIISRIGIFIAIILFGENNFFMALF